ncbi:MAG: 2-hydroxyacid dehydrogenase [Deltaproteobacteria bacterium]|nr:2-hydroxyacid dehydrogenase [Deltaproteobacteria bacterium]
MAKIALLGPFTDKMQASFQEILPAGFELFLVPTKEEYDKLPDADYIVFRTLEIREETIKTLRRTKLIQRWGVGYDIVDIQAAGEHRIPVAIMSGINATQVAEMTILQTLAALRNLIPLHNGMANGQWLKKEFEKRSYVIQGKQVGIVGLGNIGLKVAALFRAFGANIAYYDTPRRPVEIEAPVGARYMSLDKLLETSDIVSLHVPLLESTRHMINKAAIALMKPTAVIINTSRGGIIDEAALYEALSNNRLLGAGLDVFENEPLLQDSPLRSLKNVVMSPHIGGSTVDNNGTMAKRAIENIVNVSMGQEVSPGDLVNAQYLRKD